MLGFVFYNNVLYGLGVFFTLLRKPQFSYKMKFCFEIQIENSSPLLKFFFFFFFFSPRLAVQSIHEIKL